jgi:SOS-response transcriptional repressor LexA/transcriptional regulator with XRE-family HTH domain
MPPFERRTGSPIRGLVDRRIKELGLSGFQEFAEHAGIPYSTLYNIARGKKLGGGVYTFHRPSFDTRPLLARALGIREEEVTYLFTVVEYDVGYPPDSPLFEAIQTVMLERYRLSQESLHKFAEREHLVPEVLEAIYYGGRDEQGRLAQPPLGTLVDLAVALNMPRSQILARYLRHPCSNGMFWGAQDVEKMEASDLSEQVGTAGGQPVMQQVPVETAGWVGAGPEENEELDLEPIWVEERFAQGKELRAFKIRGDSMSAGRKPIFDGDLVIVNRKDKGYEGAAVIARLRSDGYVCKRLKDDKFGWHLVSANPDYTNGTPPYIGAEDVAEVVGRVIEIRHKDGEA